MQVEKKNDAEVDQMKSAAPKTKNTPDLVSDTSVLGRFWKSLERMGLEHIFTRVGTGVISLAFIGIVVWMLSGANLKPGQAASGSGGIPTLDPTGMPTLVPVSSEAANHPVSYRGGIPRLAMIHTNISDRTRTDITTYTVQAGDTVIGIGEKFGLQPETIFFANYNQLLDNPDMLQPGQVLTILPEDGLIYVWNAGDGLNGVAKFFNVKPEDIINYPLNKLSLEAVGDFTHPNIDPGTKLIVPGGTREYINWSAPRISRTDPSVAKVLGSGFCGTVSDGAVGTGSFIFPTQAHVLSGYDYSPKTNHYGIDLEGQLGSPIYASDSGVVVYSGWNDWGYGNMIVIDHGDGWQTLYGHLSQIYVGCSASVGQGAVIGLMGSTGHSSGPHLHFEIMSDQGGKVNPWDFLPR